MWRACLLFGTLAALAGTSRADHLSLHALLSGDVAVTDNELAVPLSEHPEADVFADVRPGVLFRSEGGRFTNEVVAQGEVIEYARHLASPTYNGFASWKGLLLPSPRTDLALAADASTGKVNSLSARSASDQATIAVTSGGAASVRSADASEAFGFAATPSTRVTESVFGQWMATDDNQPMPTTSNTVTTTADLGATRLFRHDSVGLAAGVTYLRLERLAPPGDVDGSHLQNQLNPHATLSWLHDFSRRWSGSLTGGFVFVNQVGADRYSPSTPSAGATGYPIATATIAYTDFWGHASLSGGRAVIPDLFIAENTLTDSAFAQAALPMYWLDRRSRSDPKLSLLGSIGYMHTQILNSESPGTSLGVFDVGLVDVGLVWLQAPGRTFGVRYEFMIQHGDNTGTGSLLEPSFFRDTVYVTFDLRFPGDVLAKLPRSQSQSLRADHSDVTPTGGGDTGTEPVVPDAPAP